MILQSAEQLCDNGKNFSEFKYLLPEIFTITASTSTLLEHTLALDFFFFKIKIIVQVSHALKRTQPVKTASWRLTMR